MTNPTRDAGDLPKHLTKTDVKRAARAADSMFDFTRRCRVSRRKGRALLRRFNLQDEIPSTADIAAGSPDIDDSPFPW